MLVSQLLPRVKMAIMCSIKTSNVVWGCLSVSNMWETLRAEESDEVAVVAVSPALTTLSHIASHALFSIRKVSAAKSRREQLTHVLQKVKLEKF